MRLELHPEARAELRSAALWYEERRPGLGDEFISAISASLDRSQRRPRILPGMARRARGRPADPQPEWPASIPWPGLLSSGPKTVRELIWQVAASLPKPDISAGETWTRPRIQAEVRRIVGEQVGAWDYSLKARFVDDIGIS